MIDIKQDTGVRLLAGLVIVAGAVLVALHRITWQEATVGIVLLGLPSVFERAKDNGKDPPPPPAAPVILAIVCLAASVMACASATPAEKRKAAEVTYLGEQLQCVDKSATIEESRACRAAVRAKWTADAGAQEGGLNER